VRHVAYGVGKRPPNRGGGSRRRALPLSTHQNGPASKVASTSLGMVGRSFNNSIARPGSRGRSKRRPGVPATASDSIATLKISEGQALHRAGAARGRP